jgi:hypothetical protein
MIQFTTLDNAKAWLNLTTETDDDLISRLIVSATGYIKGWINREIELTAYSETYGGTGSTRLNVANYPILSVQSVTIDGQPIPAKPGPTLPGFTFDFSQIILDGYRFRLGIDNVQVFYKAGFQTVEIFTIPYASPYTLQTLLLWTSDVSVYARGVQFSNVYATPSGEGQYSAVDGIYTFDPSDAGSLIAITYGYVPAEIEQACIDLVGRKYRERDRIGLASKGLAGETTAFSQSDLSADTKAMLNQFRKVVPV